MILCLLLFLYDLWFGSSSRIAVVSEKQKLLTNNYKLESIYLERDSHHRDNVGRRFMKFHVKSMLLLQ